MGDFNWIVQFFFRMGEGGGGCCCSDYMAMSGTMVIMVQIVKGNNFCKLHHPNCFQFTLKEVFQFQLWPGIA